MTFLTFLQIACVLVFVSYVVSVNRFQRADKKAGSRPEPNPFSFFPKKKMGLSRQELEAVLDPEGRNKPAPKS